MATDRTKKRKESSESFRAHGSLKTSFPSHGIQNYESTYRPNAPRTWSICLWFVLFGFDSNGCVCVFAYVGPCVDVGALEGARNLSYLSWCFPHLPYAGSLTWPQSLLMRLSCPASPGDPISVLHILGLQTNEESEAWFSWFHCKCLMYLLSHLPSTRVNILSYSSPRALRGLWRPPLICSCRWI